MSEWISVGERLPDMHEIYKDSPLTSGDVLIFNGYCVTIGSYTETYKKRIRRWVSFGVGMEVTHWMPLPKGPQCA